MITVTEIIQSKTAGVFSISPSASVFDAIRLMSEKNIGALPVVEDGRLYGILSERDYARKIILQNRTSQDTTVGDIMTAAVVTVLPADSIEHCMELMSTRNIRHLPVVSEDVLLGIISIRDVVSAIIKSQKDTIDHLHEYIRQ